MDKGHVELIEDAKKEPCKRKGYAQNTTMQKPKQGPKKKKQKNFFAIVRTCQQWWAQCPLLDCQYKPLVANVCFYSTHSPCVICQSFLLVFTTRKVGCSSLDYLTVEP